MGKTHVLPKIGTVWVMSDRVASGILCRERQQKSSGAEAQLLGESSRHGLCCPLLGTSKSPGWLWSLTLVPYERFPMPSVWPSLCPSPYSPMEPPRRQSGSC